MAGIHQLNCSTSRKNTGFGGCPVDWKLFKGAFIFDSPVSFTQSELADLQDILQTMAWQDSTTGRCIPVHNFLNPQDNTDDPTIESFTDGSKAYVRDGVNDWTFQFTAGGFCLLQALRTHSGNNTAYALFYDKDYKILGYNLNGELAAIPLEVFQALPWKMNTGSNVAKYMVRFIFDATYSNDIAEYTQANFPLSAIAGLQDLKLVINGFNHSAGLVNVSVLTECGGSNLFTQYSAQLVAALWNFSNAVSGNIIPVTSVSPLVGPQSFNVLLNTGSGNYPSNNAINLILGPNPSNLANAGLVGYASEEVELTVISS